MKDKIVKNPEYYGRPRREMLPFVPNGAGRVLDVGCGAGAFGAALIQERGPGLEVLWGLEMDPVAAERAREVLNQVRCGDAAELLEDLPPGHFDCICLNDVLEHVLEPWDLLAALRPLLAEGGRLVTSIPNVRYFWNVVDLVLKGRWEYTDEGICDRTHLRFFTRGSMAAMMTGSGYRIERMQGINPTGSLKFSLFNAMTLGRFAEMRYLQFAMVAGADT